MLERLISRTRASASRRLGRRTPVDAYWNTWIVEARTFRSAADSAEYLEWRFDKYPFFRESAGFWGEHQGETILDYGCGPGNDLTGFLLYAAPAKVIGLDVSRQALSLSAQRLRLHGFDRSRWELHRVRDDQEHLTLGDGTVDFVNCQGVLHHVSDPLAVLREFRRVIKPGGRGTVMVYNRDSIYFHLYAAYVRMIVQGLFKGQSVEEAFTGSTDGPECPISRAYTAEDFIDLCRRGGFTATFAGAYYATEELQWMRAHLDDALASPGLGEEHKAFLRELTYDADGNPLHGRRRAGIGGVYHLTPA